MLAQKTINFHNDKTRVNGTIILACLVIACFLVSRITYICIPWLCKGNTNGGGWGMDQFAIRNSLTWLFFTIQAGMVAVAFAIFVLIKKYKKVTTILGIFALGDLLITNLIAWIALNSMIGWSDNPAILVIDIFEHFAIFFVTALLFLQIHKQSLKNEYLCKVSFISDIGKFSWIHVVVFFTGAIIGSFTKFGSDGGLLQNGYFNVYGSLTNFNPNNGGSLWLLLLIPAFYVVINALYYMFYSCSNINNKKEKLPTTQEASQRKSVILFFYSTFLCIFFVDMIIQFGKFDAQAFNIIGYCICAFTLFYILFCLLVLFNNRGNVSEYKKILVYYIIVFLCVFLVGNLVESLPASVFPIENDNIAKFFETLANTCIAYGMLACVFIGLWFFA